MALTIDIQTAPVWAGYADAPSSWSGASTSTPSVSGVYEGTVARTYTFTVENDGTVAAGDTSITWSDGTEGGRLDCGAAYVAGDTILFHKGLTVAFAAGSFAASDTFTVAVTARRRLSKEMQRLVGDANPADIIVSGFERQSIDDVGLMGGGDMYLREIADLVQPSVDVRWLDGDAQRTFDRMRSLRQEVTVGENYDADTEFMWRASLGLTPLVGEAVSFSRTGAAPYLDPVSGLYRVAPDDDQARFSTGPDAPAFYISAAARENLLPRFHPKSGTLGWTLTNTSGLAEWAWTEDVRGVLDPDDPEWDSAFRAGVGVAMLYSVDTLAGQATASNLASGTHTAYVWVRGRGRIGVSLLEGAGVLGSAIETLTGDWQMITVQASAAGTGVGSLRFSAIEASHFYVSAAALYLGHFAAPPVETDGTKASSGAEVADVQMELPAEGTLSFWCRLVGTAGSNNYYLAGTTAGDFYINWNSSTPYVRATVGVNGSNHSLQVDSPTNSLDDGDFHMITLTWERDSSNSGKLDCRLFYDGGGLAPDGASASADNRTPYDVTGGGRWGTTFRLAPVYSGVASDMQFAEVRVDGRAWTAQEVYDQWRRLGSDHGRHLLRALGGRFFRPMSMGHAFLNPRLADGRLLASVQLQQSFFDESNAVGRR